LFKEDNVNDSRRKYRAIGQAYDKLFKAPPPSAELKQHITVQDLAKECEEYEQEKGEEA
jgi:hypothetical protein